MLRHNRIATAEKRPSTVLKLAGRAGAIDLSAWISTSILAIGILLVGPAAIARDFGAGGFGLPLLLGSYVGFIAAVLLLQNHMRVALSANSFGRPAALVTDGIFKFTRNPIYLAFLLPLASLAYFSPLTAIATMGVYVTTMNLTVIRKEERDLQNCFGADYATYRSSVPRWLV